MGRPFILLGDTTDHGGIVVEASGTTVIVSGDATMIIDGKPAARHGDKCACGATLIAAQLVSSAL
jgi:uncharacterized Zn-binding protein involved in type VI secretion